jgi:hypothetical protein
MFRRRRGRPNELGRIKLQPLYSGPCPLAINKLEDLKVLVKFILPVYHPFYTSLDGSENEDSASETDDIDSD